MRGLRVRPQSEELIGIAKSDGLENTKCPNRERCESSSRRFYFKSTWWRRDAGNGKTATEAHERSI